MSYADGDRLVVTVPDNAPWQSCRPPKDWACSCFFDETSYRLMFEALDRVIGARDNRLAYLRDLSIRACRLPN